MHILQNALHSRDSGRCQYVTPDIRVYIRSDDSPGRHSAFQTISGYFLHTIFMVHRIYVTMLLIYTRYIFHTRPVMHIMIIHNAYTTLIPTIYHISHKSAVIVSPQFRFQFYPHQPLVASRILHKLPLHIHSSFRQFNNFVVPGLWQGVWNGLRGRKKRLVLRLRKGQRTVSRKLAY